MNELNAVGDVVLTDADAMRALAHPTRLTVLDTLRRQGQATSAELAAALGIDRPDAAEHLAALEDVELVTREGDGDIAHWRAVGRGVFFEIPEEKGPAQEAARELTRAMLLLYADLPRMWAETHEPRLSISKARAAGMFNARVSLTTEELQDVQAKLEMIMEPYTSRASQAVAGASPVRILAYFLPEPDA